MTTPIEKEYGTWESPLTLEDACGSSVSLVRMYCDPHDTENLYWTELRPNEEGRTILFSKKVNDDVTSHPVRWTPETGFDVSTRVHEYGGAAYFVNNGVAYCSNTKDSRIYRQSKDDKTCVEVTLKGKEFRYADGDFSKSGNFFFCVREDHTVDQPEKVVNQLVAINATTGEETVTASGNDFYSSPRVSPDGKKLAWITWIHPNMPWDETELWVSDFEINGEQITVGSPKKIAGEKGINFMEPNWTCDGRLLVICDKKNWWNLYEVDVCTGTLRVCKEDLKNELGGPCWNFGHRSYGTNPCDSNEVAVLYGGKPALLSLSSGEYTKEIQLADHHVTDCIYTPNGQYLFLQVISPKERAKIIRFNLATGAVEDFHRSTGDVIGDEILSLPIQISYSVTPREGSDIKQAYGYYYPPKNARFAGLPDTKPPILLKIHGGPTSAASMGMDLQKQYFTSRGIGIFDVNYRGSTGYGTSFRNELKRNWGVFDIQDCLEGALTLVDQGYGDRDKLLISGGSSGGYTTLACLTFDKHDDNNRVFKAGASYYGISNLEALTQHTHKFESRYCDEMIAPYPAERQTYLDRSPGYEKNSANFKSACCFLQGALDEVVPPDQSKTMYDILLNVNKLPCSYVLFEDEYHGFNKAENKIKALGGEYYFYLRILNLELSKEEMDKIKIPIENYDN